MRRSRLTLLALTCLGGCAVSIGRPGDESPLTGLGQSLEPVPLRPAWRRVLNEGPIYATKPHELAAPAFDPINGRVCVGSRGRWFQCLKAGNGELLWRERIDGGVSGQAVFDGSRVLVGTDDGQLLAFDAATGREEWAYRVPGAVIEAPVIAGDNVYFVDGTNSIYAVRRADGGWRWQYRREAPAEFALVGESRPLVTGGRVYVGFSDGHLVALDAADGAMIWNIDLAPEHDRFQDVDAEAIHFGDTLFAASAASGLYALDPESGEVRWTSPVAGVTDMLRVDRDIVVSSDRGTLMRVTGTDGRVLWRVRFDSGAPGPTIPVGSLLTVGLSQGGLYFVEPDTGRPVQVFVPGHGLGGPVSGGGDAGMFVLSNGGVLYAFLGPR